MSAKALLVSGLVMLALSAGPAQAAIIFSDLGTNAPPATVGPVAVTPFDLAAQAAIPDFTLVSVIVGTPFQAGPVTLSSLAGKLTVPDTWASWSHGYTGPVFAFIDFLFVNSVTLNLPYPARAFYVYVEPNAFDTFRVTATANDGTTSGPIQVTGLGGANGFGFFTDNQLQGIVSVTVDVDPDAFGFAIGEFGIGPGVSSQPPITASASVPTLTEWGMVLFVGLLVLGALRRLAGHRAV